MARRVLIRWTTTAKNQLSGFPLKVRKGILAKADGLLLCDDPRKAYKPLHGPLQGFYRFAYARYRAVYSVEEEELANGNVLVQITITFVAVGRRKEHDKHDIYQIAQKLVDSGIIEIPSFDPPDSTEP